ncbi:MAG: FapA family protein, partial [Candidatus Cloacimonadaceae bacterium]|nr:FapA family protein [Candidatus Cloacimonadaceae bacterium]
YADVCNCEINSASDIEIKGNLVSTKLYTEGKLVVGGQIIGCRESYLHVWGDTICHSVIDSRLICKGSLHFAGEIREAQIIAEKGVIGAETDSLIHSGSIQSSGSITAAVIGNTEEEPVEIEITISAYYKNYLMIRTKELIKMKQNPEISPEVIDETSTEIKHLESELDRDMSVFLKHERLEKLTIKASQRLHANTTLRILKHSYQIKHQEQDAEYREKD